MILREVDVFVGYDNVGVYVSPGENASRHTCLLGRIVAALHRSVFVECFRVLDFTI